MNTIFMDVVLSAQVSDGVVRLVVASYQGPEKEGKRPVGDQQQIVTTLPGLLQLQSQINQVVEGLVERKVLRKNETAQPSDLIA